MTARFGASADIERIAPIVIGRLPVRRLCDTFGGVKIISSPVSMQRQSTQWLRQGRRIGFVPTMGDLHPGHLSLVRQARKVVGEKGRVVVSIYVNPTQFGPSEDFSNYPRNFAKDRLLCKEAGVDVVFAPSDAEMYAGTETAVFSTYVVEEALSCRMEGSARPTHFRGVTTIVAKLFNIVRPDVAVFGAKDWQQAAIIRRMVRDLNFPIRILVASTFREASGLAMSSRNRYLRGALRMQAKMLSSALELAKTEVRRAGKAGVKASELRRKCERLIRNAPEARVDYIEFFNSETLEPLRNVGPGTHMALAVFVGATRLIDNRKL